MELESLDLEDVSDGSPVVESVADAVALADLETDGDAVALPEARIETDVERDAAAESEGSDAEGRLLRDAAAVAEARIVRVPVGMEGCADPLTLAVCDGDAVAVAGAVTLAVADGLRVLTLGVAASEYEGAGLGDCEDDATLEPVPGGAEAETEGVALTLQLVDDDAEGDVRADRDAPVAVAAEDSDTARGVGVAHALESLVRDGDMVAVGDAVPPS